MGSLKKQQQNESTHFSGSHLKLVKSAISSRPDYEPTENAEDEEGLGYSNYSHDSPQFIKHESASRLELFYDLWFVANLTVFNTYHDIADLSSLYSFMGYFALLWVTWFLTTAYDARFATDSVLERVFRAIHLGVMVGFAVVGPAFDPENPLWTIERAMCYCLCASRIVLSMQYGTILFSIRKYRRGKKGLLLLVVTNFVSAVIYLGISFRFVDNSPNKVYIVWYIGQFIEMAFQLVQARISNPMSFMGTHIGERMNLLTLIILGEGVIVIAENVNVIVQDTIVKENNAAWSASVIGELIAGVAFVYIVFQIYFDWMHRGNMSEHGLSSWIAWHCPFHLGLVLTVAGGNQFIAWRQALDSVQSAILELKSTAMEIPLNSSTEVVVDALREKMVDLLDKWPPENLVETWDAVNSTLEELTELPSDFWSQWDNTSNTSPERQEWLNASNELGSAVIDGVFAAFEIAAPENQTPGGGLDQAEENGVEATYEKFRLVFYYTYACAGFVLIFMTILHLVSKRKGWTPFNIFRVLYGVAVGIILGLVCIVAATNNDNVDGFLGSSWQMPVITTCYFSVLVVTHLPDPFRLCTKGPAKRSNAVPTQKFCTESGHSTTQNQGHSFETETGTGPSSTLLSAQSPQYTQPHIQNPQAYLQPPEIHH